MSDLPTPRYKIGDIVYRGWTTSITKTHPCPDCLGTMKWQVTTPVGSTLTATCPRCVDASYGTRDLPSLKYHAYDPIVEVLTIGSVQIDTAALDGSVVKYMCRETGIGSGSVYKEDMLLPTREEADRYAEMLAAEANAKIVNVPEKLADARLAKLELVDAIVEHAWQVRWRAWEAYRSIKEELAMIVEDHQAGDVIDVDQLRELLNDKSSYLTTPSLEQLLEAAKAGHVDNVRQIMEEFYAMTQLARKENTRG